MDRLKGRKVRKKEINQSKIESTTKISKKFRKKKEKNGKSRKLKRPSKNGMTKRRKGKH